MEECSRVHGNFGPWGMWSLCSRSCGGLGTRTRARQCVLPTLVPGGLSCGGPLQDLEYCFSPECPGKGARKEPDRHLPGRVWLGLSILLVSLEFPSFYPVALDFCLGLKRCSAVDVCCWEGTLQALKHF